MKETIKVVTYCRQEVPFRPAVLFVSVSRFVISQIAVLRSPHQCILIASNITTHG